MLDLVVARPETAARAASGHATTQCPSRVKADITRRFIHALRDCGMVDVRRCQLDTTALGPKALRPLVR